MHTKLVACFTAWEERFKCRRLATCCYCCCKRTRMVFLHQVIVHHFELKFFSPSSSSSSHSLHLPLSLSLSVSRSLAFFLPCIELCKIKEQRCTAFQPDSTIASLRSLPWQGLKVICFPFSWAMWFQTASILVHCKHSCWRKYFKIRTGDKKVRVLNKIYPETWGRVVKSRWPNETAVEARLSLSESTLRVPNYRGSCVQIKRARFPLQIMAVCPFLSPPPPLRESFRDSYREQQQFPSCQLETHKHYTNSLSRKCPSVCRHPRQDSHLGLQFPDQWSQLKRRKESQKQYGVRNEKRAYLLLSNKHWFTLPREC